MEIYKLFGIEYNLHIVYLPYFVTQGRLTAISNQNYWVLGRCPSSGILETREHGVFETGSVPALS
jgi:hypothetical protein